MTRSGYVLALYGGLSLIALLLSAGRGDVDLYQLHSEGGGWLLLVSPVLGLLIGVAIVVLTRLSVQRFEWARGLHRDFRALLGELTGREILILAIASSVGEELLFRGALLPWLGLWPQAILFALMHVGPSKRFLPWTVSALALGLFFGLLVEWTGNLGAPIAAHFAVNFLNLRFIVETPMPEMPEQEAAKA